MERIRTGTWSRLKACPDCRWVFYDHSRNGSKRWCLMYAGGPADRACGTIAKVRRYRSKKAAASATAPVLQDGDSVYFDATKDRYMGRSGLAGPGREAAKA